MSVLRLIPLVVLTGLSAYAYDFRLDFMLNYEKDYKGDLHECVEANSIGGAYWS